MSTVVIAVLNKTRSSTPRHHRSSPVKYLGSSSDNVKSRNSSPDMNTVQSLNIPADRPSTVTYW